MPARSLSTVLHALVLSITSAVHAQAPWCFQQVSTADGLTDDAIDCLHQDRAGFLWIGTESGLNKYDGHHVWTWRRSDGLSGDQVSAVLEDQAGTIWVATRDGGLTRMDPSTGALRVFRHVEGDPTSIASDRLTALFDLDDTTLMIGAEQVPLLFLDKRTYRFRYWPNSGPIAPAQAVERAAITTNWCHAITDMGDGHLGIAFLLVHRQALIDRASGRERDGLFQAVPGMETITGIARVGRWACGVGWQRWLTVRDLAQGTESTRAIALPDEGTCLVPLDEDHVLVGTRASGLVRVDLRDGSLWTMRHLRSDRRTIADGRIRCLLRDDAQRIWVGTQHGLSVYDPASAAIEAVPLYPSEANDQPDLIAYRIDHAPSGAPLVSTNDGWFSLEAGGRVVHQRPSARGAPLRTTGLFRTPVGDLLGAEEGLFQVDMRSGNATSLTATWPQNEEVITDLFQVRSLQSDTLAGHPALIAGVAGYGLTWLDLTDRRIRFFVPEPANAASLGSNLTRQVLRDRSGRYWVATASGLYHWMLDRTRPANTFQAFRSDTTALSLAGNDVQALAEDAAGGIWVATRDGGLCRIHDGRVERYPCPRPLGNTVFGITLDRVGRVWGATAEGIEVLDPRDGRSFRLPIVGTSGPAALTGCITTLPDGRIAFVAENTFFRVDPERALQAPPAPRPYLTGLDVLGRDVSARISDAAFTLAADERVLTATLSALQLAGPRPFHCLVRVEGVDPEPRSTDAQGRISYGSLPPGTFRLLAQTIDGHGRASAEVHLLTLHVAAPFWQRWWFFALVAFVMSAAVFAWSRYRIRQAVKLHAVRDRIASDLHDEVGSSLSAITIGSELAAQLSTRENEQVRSLMTRIGQTSSESLRSMSDIVWAIDPKNDEGEALVKRLRRIAHDLLESKGVAVEMVVGPGVEALRLPMDVRKELLLIGKEAMHNVSKHADARQVRITIERAHGRLTLAVKDDGKGFVPAADRAGHGSESMHRRAAALGSRLQLRSAPGAGTEVQVALDLSRIKDR